ncbi:hypothetical protein LIER_04970 [Lithospermum erythrorhizon]|uniref:Uncharacterized protein n=1 Tax=Lithospermum erythrorhizon TaxID=34254 RepID=A0AAV3P0M3_LITER
MGMFTSHSPTKGWNIFTGNKPGKVAENRWHSLWCFLKGDMDARVPMAWVSLEKADRPKSPPTDETFPTLEKMRRIFTHKMHLKIFYEEGGKRPIAFKKVKTVKKVASSSRPSTTRGLPPRPAPAANIAHSSPVPVESDHASFSLPIANLVDELPSSSLPSKRPFEGGVSQGKKKQAKASSELYNPPFPTYDPLMDAGLFTLEILALPTHCQGVSKYANAPLSRVISSPFTL